MNSLDVRDFPPATDCIRDRLAADALLEGMPPISAQRAAEHMLAGAALSAGDDEGLKPWNLTKSDDPESLWVADRIITSAAFKCGQAAGRNACSKWRYDIESHAVVAINEIAEE